MRKLCVLRISARERRSGTKVLKRLCHRSCGFEHVEFADETDTHLVVRNLLHGFRGGSSLNAEDEEDAHACLASLSAFLASHMDVLSIQVCAWWFIDCQGVLCSSPKEARSLVINAHHSIS